MCLYIQYTIQLLEFRCELKDRFTVILFFCELHQENEEGTCGQETPASSEQIRLHRGQRLLCEIQQCYGGVEC